MGRPLPPIEKRATHLGYAMSNGGLAAHSMQFAAVVSVVARRDTGYEARAIRQYAVRMEWQRILDRRKRVQPLPTVHGLEILLQLVYLSGFLDLATRKFVLI